MYICVSRTNKYKLNKHRPDTMPFTYEYWTADIYPSYLNCKRERERERYVFFLNYSLLLNTNYYFFTDASCVNVVMPLDNVSQSFPLFSGLLFKGKQSFPLFSGLLFKGKCSPFLFIVAFYSKVSSPFLFIVDFYSKVSRPFLFLEAFYSKVNAVLSSL